MPPSLKEPVQVVEAPDVKALKENLEAWTILPRPPKTQNGRVEYPKSNLKLEDHCIDEVRKLRVAVIGAGLSGITSGILLPAKVPNIDLTIFEKNQDVVRLSLFLSSSISNHLFSCK
jgi:hypothetical protein